LVTRNGEQAEEKEKGGEIPGKRAMKRGGMAVGLISWVKEGRDLNRSELCMPKQKSRQKRGDRTRAQLAKFLTASSEGGGFKLDWGGKGMQSGCPA